MNDSKEKVNDGTVTLKIGGVSVTTGAAGFKLFNQMVRQEFSKQNLSQDMETVVSYCKLLFDVVHKHRISTGGDCRIALTHPDTFKALLDERMSDNGMSVISTPGFSEPYAITKLNIVGIEVRRCPDVEVGIFELY